MRSNVCTIALLIATLSFAQSAIITSELAGLEKEIPLTNSEEVEQYIEQYKTLGKKHTQIALDQFLPFDQQLKALFSENQVNEELRYISLAYFLEKESNLANSGPFYLDKKTAIEGGLEISKYVDERLDVMKAALVFCKELNEDSSVINDWPNHLKEIVSGGLLDEPKALNLSEHPTYIKSTYSRFVAAVYVANKYDYLGFSKRDETSQTEVEIKEYTTLYQLSRTLNIDYPSLKINNPVYVKEVVPSDREYNLVKLPSSAVLKFKTLKDKAYDYIPTEVYTATELKIIERKVVESATLKEVATAFTDEELYGDETLLTEVVYSVRNGDILLNIADLFDCEVVQIKRWNGLVLNNLLIDQKLVIKVSLSKRAYYQQIDKMTNDQRQIILRKD